MHGLHGLHGPAFSSSSFSFSLASTPSRGRCGPVSFGLASVVKETVWALVDFATASGIMMFITPVTLGRQMSRDAGQASPVILGRQMSPVILGSRPGDLGQARRARLSWAIPNT